MLVIPRKALRSVGQLDLVNVVENGRVSRRAIRRGRELDENVEVLAGLAEGEQVEIPSPSGAAQEATHG